MRFERFGLSFDYPDNWALDAGDSAGRYATVTVLSPGGGFWTVSGHEAGGDPGLLATAVVDQMRDEYREIDVEPASDEVLGCTLSGYDMNFYCLDLTNTAQVRTLPSAGSVHVIFCQAEDREWDRIAAVFAAITTSFVRGLKPGAAGSAAGG